MFQYILDCYINFHTIFLLGWLLYLILILFSFLTYLLENTIPNRILYTLIISTAIGILGTIFLPSPELLAFIINNYRNL